MRRIVLWSVALALAIFTNAVSETRQIHGTPDSTLYIVDMAPGRDKESPDESPRAHCTIWLTEDGFAELGRWSQTAAQALVDYYPYTFWLGLVPDGGSEAKEVIAQAIAYKIKTSWSHCLNGRCATKCRRVMEINLPEWNVHCS